MALKSKASGGFLLNLFQARLSISVASIGTMNPQVHIHYGCLTMKSKTATGQDQNPHWNEGFSFEITENELELIVYHKPLLLKEVEIGRCNVKIEDTAGWFEITKEGKKVGSIRIALREEKETSVQSTNHSSNNSWDLQNEYTKKLAELELEKEEVSFYKKKYKLKLEKLKQERRRLQGYEEGVITDEALGISTSLDELKYSNFEVAEENNYSRHDGSLKLIFEKIQKHTKKMQNAQMEIIKRKQLLRAQEENLVQEKLRIKQEWENMEKAKIEFEVVKKRISDEYLKLKHHKQKLKLQNKLIEMNKQRANKTARQKERHQQILDKIKNSKSPEQSDWSENPIWTDNEPSLKNDAIDFSYTQPRRAQSIEGHPLIDFHTARTPQTSEKPRPPLHPLSANSSSRLICFE
ncbi:unnamed protein product [Blepharisma stoltei]|uniref:C2 domain-containing protein n=1 Tax=Blepharisma stoltei TaxID=1481888 RepID=A0AAU9IRY2_9CILI|nr:unnamed protein product [Blepharisma stoltei]